MSTDAKKMIETEEKLSKYDGEDRIITSYDALDLYQRMKQQKNQVVMKSDIPTLDAHIGSFEGGELTVISGLTGNGKTLLAQTFTRAFSGQEKRTLWFTYEVQAEQFLAQFGDALPHFLMPAKLTSNVLDWIHRRVWEAKIKYGCDAVFIDHLHFLVDMNRHNLSLEIGHVMRTLKKMALHFNAAFFLLAHTSKIKPEVELDNDALRDSSFVAQEADNVLFVWRTFKGDQVTPNQAILKISKNRRNGVMNAKVRLIKVGRFLEESFDNDR